MIGIGIFLRSGGAGGGAPRVTYAVQPLAEDADVGDLAVQLGLANFEGDGDYELLEGSSAALELDEGDSSRILVASGLDYETAPGLTAIVRFVPDEGDPLPSRTIPIPVANVIELPVFLEMPEVTGVAQVGQSVTCSPGVLEMPDGAGAEITRQWFREDDEDEALEGETGLTLTAGEALLGETAFCRVTATNAAGSTSEDSNTVGPFLPGAESPYVATFFWLGF